MKYIRNYKNFSERKRLFEKNTINEEFGTEKIVKKVVAPVVEPVVVPTETGVEDVEEIVDLGTELSDGSVEDKIEFVEQTIDEVEGISAAEIFGGIGIGVAAVLGAVGIKKAYDYITSDKGQGDETFRTLFGSTSASPCFTTLLVKFGLPVATLGNWRTWEGTVGDLLDAIQTKDQTKIFANFKPTFLKTGNQLTVPKGAKDNIGYNQVTKQQENLPDFLAVNGVTLNNRLVFNLLNRTQKVVACGNGLLALSRLVRSAWHINYDDKTGTGDFAAWEPGVIYHTGIIEEMGDVKDPSSRAFSKLKFGFKAPHIKSTLQDINENLTAYAWDKDEFFKRIFARGEVTKNRSGAGYMRWLEGYGKDAKYFYFTENGQQTGAPLQGEKLNQAILRQSKFGIKFNSDMTVFRDAERTKKSLKASFLRLMVQIVPTDLYGNDPAKFPGAWESISNKLGLESLTDSEIEGFLKEIENGFTKSSQYPGSLDPPSKEIFKKINQKIVDKFQRNFDKISDNLLDEETTLKAKSSLNKTLQDPSIIQDGLKFSALDALGDPQAGSTSPKGKSEIKVTKKELGEGG